MKGEIVLIKRILAFDLAVLIALLTIFTPLGFSTNMITASSVGTVINVNPPFPITDVTNWPSLGEIAFAEPILQHFMGLDYQIHDVFYIDVLYRFGMVTLQFDHTHYDYDFIAIVFNQKHIYYMTPIIIDDYMLFDYTNVKPGKYKVYIIQNFPTSEND